MEDNLKEHFYWTFGGKKMIYGYVRVSTQIQKIERQITNILRAYLDEVIKKESLLN